MNTQKQEAKGEVLSFKPTFSTVPLKHRSTCPSAHYLNQYINSNEDFSEIRKNLVVNGVCKSEERAQELLLAWVQWFSVGATSVTKSFVMLAGPIDRTFHELILNTKWYFRFCSEYTGVYTHHEKLTEQQLSEVCEIKSAVEETLQRLEKAFGNDLHPELKKWVRSAKKGTVTAKSVSCLGNNGPFDIIPRKSSN